MRGTWVWSLGWEDPLEKRKTTHSGILAWRIPWTILSISQYVQENNLFRGIFFIVIAMKFYAFLHKNLIYLGPSTFINPHIPFGLTKWLSGKEPTWQCKGLIHGLGRFLWRWKWQPTLVFLPGKSHGHWSLADIVHGVPAVGHELVTKQQHIHFGFLLNFLSGKKIC